MRLRPRRSTIFHHGGRGQVVLVRLTPRVLCGKDVWARRDERVCSKRFLENMVRGGQDLQPSNSVCGTTLPTLAGSILPRLSSLMTGMDQDNILHRCGPPSSVYQFSSMTTFLGRRGQYG